METAGPTIIANQHNNKDLDRGVEMRKLCKVELPPGISQALNANSPHPNTF